MCAVLAILLGGCADEKAPCAIDIQSRVVAFDESVETMVTSTNAMRFDVMEACHGIASDLGGDPPPLASLTSNDDAVAVCEAAAVAIDEALGQETHFTITALGVGGCADGEVEECVWPTPCDTPTLEVDASPPLKDTIEKNLPALIALYENQGESILACGAGIAAKAIGVSETVFADAACSEDFGDHIVGSFDRSYEASTSVGLLTAAASTVLERAMLSL